MKERILQILFWIEEHLGVTRLPARLRMMAATVATCLIVILCLTVPGALIVREAEREKSVVQSANQTFYTTDMMSAYLDIDTFYNRLMLMTGQWDSRLDVAEAYISYDGSGYNNVLSNLILSHEKGDGGWQTREGIMQGGNVIRAVCNLTEFGLLPREWNLYYSSWPLQSVMANIYTDSYFLKFNCVLYDMDFLNYDVETSREAHLYVDNESGDFVGLHLTYDEDSLREHYANELTEMMQSISTAYYGRTYISAWADGLRMHLRDDDALELSLLIENLYNHMGTISEEQYAVVEKELSGLEYNTEYDISINGESEMDPIDYDERAQRLYARAEKNTAYAMMEYASELTEWRSQSAIDGEVVSFLDRLGMTEITNVTGQMDLSLLHTPADMGDIPEGASVYRCKEILTGDVFYFVLDCQKGDLKFYFATATEKPAE